jgi:phosphoglycolate phosphatase-like HAD superfamily hydrolase
MNYDEVANCARAQLETAIERLKLTNSQRAAIWEVRRKSKNRIAAARCRKRTIEDMKENDETIEQLRTIFETKQNQNWELRATLEQILVDISAKTEDANNENLDSEQKSLLEEVRKALVEPEIEIAGDIEKLQPASDYVNVRIA